ncbi:MAG: rRNA methyltransferase, partial [Spirochaetaceae bacterium]|nr:rRNA methyltransferase [Spirochaetaceae bacterium]
MVESRLFPPLGDEVRGDIENLLLVIDRTFPLKRRFYDEMPENIARLSRLLTKDRSELNGGYMGSPAMLNAYLRYFLPWNVYRLSLLLPSLSLERALGTTENAEIIELGSGPLSLPVSLWTALPRLRALPLGFLCADQNGAALEAGKRLFRALAGEGCPWRIKTRRASLGARLEARPAALVCAVNVCNEFIQRLPQADAGGLRAASGKLARYLASLAGDGGSVLVAEPGAPRPAQALAFMREAFAVDGLSIEAPCPATRRCAMPGGRRGVKWCHFNIDADGAPEALRRLSAQAGLHKEKVTLSFLLAAKTGKTRAVPAGTQGLLAVRVLSDAFPLPDSAAARYACSEKGLTLLRG